jgi:predicted RNA-binding protein (virulence factor B family)
LEDFEGTEDVLLPNKYITDDMEIGDEIKVFVYNDSEDRIVATTQKPYIAVNQYALLRVNEVNNIGAFLDWGLEKDLLAPFKNQARKMEEGKSYIVYLYEDEETDRLVASSKVDKFLKKELEEDNDFYAVGDEVKLLVRGESELGVNVIVENEYAGLIYASDVFDHIPTGKRITGYIRQIREDGKLDISLQPIGVASIEPNADKVYKMLRESDGFLPFHDKSNADDIRHEFNMSKKLFKKAIGSLYRERMIEMKDDGIYLIKK